MNTHKYRKLKMDAEQRQRFRAFDMHSAIRAKENSMEDTDDILVLVSLII